MKIGLLTWFNNLNYGTVLQLCALYNYLKDEFGAEVEIINYIPNEKHEIDKKKTLSDKPVRRGLSMIKKKLGSTPSFDEILNEKYPAEYEKKKEAFKEFLDDFHFSKRVSDADSLKALEKGYDLIVCGSDQIWNPRTLNHVFYLSFAESTPKISYSASLGISYIPKYAKAPIKKYLSDFRAVSIREDACKNELESICGKSISVVCDPTLLIDKEKWLKKAAEPETRDNYFLNYYLGTSPIHQSAFEITAELLSENAVTVAQTEETLERSGKKGISYSPAEFIGLVKNADFVLCDSFHAVCFCIIFEKPFCVVLKHDDSDPFNQNSRIHFLLEKLKLENRIAKSNTDVKAIINMPINYEEVNKKLGEFAEISKEYLRKNVY